MEKNNSNYKTRRSHIENIASNYTFKVSLSDKPANYVSIKNIPASMKEAVSCSNFWGDVLNEFHKDINKIDFFYESKSEEVKYNQVSPQAILMVDKPKSLIKMITNEKEWKRLNEVSKETDDFSVPYVFSLKNLCYRVNIPLECINGVTFNQTDFLNEDYKSPKENSSETGVGGLI